MSSAEFDPLHQVVLSEPIADNNTKTTRGEAKIVRYGNSNVTVHASLAEPGILVLTDSYLPGLEGFSSTERKQRSCRQIIFFAV